MQRLLVVLGTRREAIKMAPVIKALREQPLFEVFVCITAQPRDKLDRVLSLFEISPDYDLGLFRGGQTLTAITTAILNGIGPLLDELSPDVVLVHGDTTATMATSMAAFYRQIPIANVEAGLRCGNMLSSWPEEMNRRVSDALARWYFTSTPEARDNLIAEGVCPDWIIQTGNPAIDALVQASQLLDSDPMLRFETAKRFPFLDSRSRMILVTGQGRDNFGAKFESFCMALAAVARRYGNVKIVYAVHLKHPQSQHLAKALLANIPNIYLIEPQEYLPFVHLMRCSYLIITDSGGLQEEAPSLGKPVLVTCDSALRPEAMEAGAARFVGTDMNAILEAVDRLQRDDREYQLMAQAHNPYGDGHAGWRIAQALRHELRTTGSGEADFKQPAAPIGALGGQLSSTPLPGNAPL